MELQIRLLKKSFSEVLEFFHKFFVRVRSTWENFNPRAGYVTYTLLAIAWLILVEHQTKLQEQAYKVKCHS